MLRGLYTAATGMITESMRTDVTANNVANANTVGYKKDTLISREFEELLLKRVNDGAAEPAVGGLGRGSWVDEIATMQEQGASRQTGNPFDLAIVGQGFFMVETPEGVRYTRNGSFTRSADGELVDMEGRRVLNSTGQPINIPDGEASVAFGADGQIYIGNEPLDTLGFVEFADRRSLLKIGNNLYAPQEGQTPAAATGSIRQGILEASNVNIVSEMVNLINGYRAYEANSKALTTQDSLLQKAVNDVGKI